MVEQKQRQTFMHMLCTRTCTSRIDITETQLRKETMKQSCDVQLRITRLTQSPRGIHFKFSTPYFCQVMQHKSLIALMDAA